MLGFSCSVSTSTACPFALHGGIQLPDARYDTQDRPIAPGQRFRELAIFLLLALAIWPILSIAFVGAYGFIVWIYQIFTGPPGPPTVGH
ncbi:periplasmic nitrate reductase, NapE protein [Paracoccus litorisediminis]|uniref:periplasmic nitrate reductase, NapE protein n=1 Tax=Paracoccus litorisediminis TaxID=2006130 RepID=UPI0031B5D397